MATKRVDYRVFDEKCCIYTVKNNVLEGFLVSMFELASGTGPWKISRKHCNLFQGFEEIRELNVFPSLGSPHGGEK